MVVLLIKELREARGLTQEELAAKCGRTKSAVAKWESDKASPPAKLLPTVAEALGVTLGELYGEAA